MIARLNAGVIKVNFLEGGLKQTGGSLYKAPPVYFWVFLVAFSLSDFVPF
jgi:hypothetical protein